MRWTGFWTLYLACLAAVLAAAGAAALWGASAQQDAREELAWSELERRTEAMAPAVERALETGAGEFQAELAPLAAAAGARVTVVSATGVVLFDSEHDARSLENHASRPEVQEAFRRGAARVRRQSATSGGERLYVARSFDDGQGQKVVLRVSSPTTPSSAGADRTGAAILAVVLVSAGSLLAFGAVLVRRLRAPLAATADMAEAIARGDYRRASAPRGATEIQRLSEAIGTMTAQLEHRLEMMTVDRNKVLAILSSMVEGVVAVDQNERVVHINTVASTLLDVDPATSVGRRVWEVIRVSAVQELLDRTRASGAPVSAECVLSADEHNPSGAVLELRAAPLRDGSGAVLVLHDVTALRKLENIRRDFVANVSHELKTPLTAIRGLVETMLDDPQMPEETARRFLEKIRDQSGRLSTLVTDLLTLARIESGAVAPERRTLDARAVVRECAARAALNCEHKRLEFAAEIPAEPVWALADDESLRQIVDNLLDNACKYTPSGGSVRLTLRSAGGQLEIGVRDSGIGIDPRDRERIFERFYRVDKARSRELGGTGLGLSIVKHLVQSLGGAVAVQSELGRGSHFRVNLPSAATPDSVDEND
mgnify:CR=1 FL=1